MNRVQKGIIFALGLAIIVMLAILADSLLFKPLEYSLVKLVMDDAGYYFNISRNFCLGHGFTFDRVNKTSGFNPLFFLILISLYTIFLPSSYPILSCYRLGVGASLVVFILGVWLFYLLVKMIVQRIFSASDFKKHLLINATVLCYVASFCLKPIFGLDSVFILLILNLYGVLVLKRGFLSPSLGACALDGALLGALFLARVDSLVFLATTYFILLFLARRSKADIAGVLLRIVSTALVISPYILYAYAKFGTWLPVSAKLKTNFPVIDIKASLALIFSQGASRLDQAHFIITFIVATAIVIFTLVVVLRNRSACERWTSEWLLLVVLSFYLSGRLIFMLLFSRHDVQFGFALYVVPLNLLVAIMGFGWLKRKGWRLAKLHFMSWALIFFAFAIYGKSFRESLVLRKIFETPNNEIRLAEIVHGMTMPEDVIYGGAFGIAGFLADRKWINGDGVVNTYEYYHILWTGDPDDLRRFLKKNKVKYVVYAPPWKFAAKRVLHSQTLLERGGDKVYYFIELKDTE